MPWGSEKGFYAVRCMVQSLALRGSRDLQCEDSRQSLPIARVSGWGCLCVDLHVGETHVRVSVMMLPALRGSDGKSHVSCHMHESVCFSRFRFRPSDAQSQDGLPHMSGQMELCLELRPADFGTSNRGACSEDVVGLGWSDQAFQVFEDNLGDCSKIASLLPNEWVRPCVSVLVPQKWSLQVLKTRL